MWIARSYFGLSLFSHKPKLVKDSLGEKYWSDDFYGEDNRLIIDDSLFPQVTYKNSPVEVELVIKNKAFFIRKNTKRLRSMLVKAGLKFFPKMKNTGADMLYVQCPYYYDLKSENLLKDSKAIDCGLNEKLFMKLVNLYK